MSQTPPNRSLLVQPDEPSPGALLANDRFRAELLAAGLSTSHLDVLQRCFKTKPAFENDNL